MSCHYRHVTPGVVRTQEANRVLRGPDTARIIRSYPVIMEYARKIHDKYFSDYERWDD